MARIEHDREDLFAEATSFEPRCEVRLPDGRVVVIGLRRDGVLVIYLGPDEMLQFDAAGGLRRAFRHGVLYRTQGHGLAQLTRQRSATESVLSREDLSPSALQTLWHELQASLQPLVAALGTAQAVVLRQIPEGDVTVIAQLATRLQQTISPAPRLARAIPTRRDKAPRIRETGSGARPKLDRSGDEPPCMH